MPAPPARPLPAIARLAPGLFYGWILAFAILLVSFVGVGIGFYGMTLFLNVFTQDRGWDTASVSLATSVYFITSGLVGTAIGRTVDRVGARGFMLGGSVVMALALVALGRVTEPWHLYVVYPVMALGFAMTGNIPTSAIITRWFVARRARAMSIAHTGVSMGGMVLVPLSAGLIETRGLATATAVLAALLVAVVFPMVVGVLRWSPEAFGLEPDGIAKGESEVGGAGFSHLDPAVQQRSWSRRGAMRTGAFWTLGVAFSAILFCQVAAAMHQMAFLREHLGATAAASAVGTTAFGSMMARLIVGGFADRMSKRRLGVALMLLQSGALVAFALGSSAPVLFAASLVFGFTVGNLFMLQTLFVGELFGMVSFGTVLGVLQLLTQTVSGLGPWALGLLYAAFGGYRPGLLILAGVAMLAAGTLWQVRPPPRQTITAS